jgi:hypothetical protein
VDCGACYIYFLSIRERIIDIRLGKGTFPRNRFFKMWTVVHVIFIFYRGTYYRYRLGKDPYLSYQTNLDKK